MGKLNHFPIFFLIFIPFFFHPLNSVFISIHDIVQVWSLSLLAWIWFLSCKQPETITKKKKSFLREAKKSEIWRRQRWEIVEDCDLRSSEREVHSLLLGFLKGISISHFGWFEEFLWLTGIIFCFSLNLNLNFICLFLKRT